MLFVEQIKEKDIDLCYSLDSNTISLWSKKQWSNEFRKKGIKIFGLLLENLVIGICVVHVVVDEAQINYFVVSKKFRKNGFGTYLMNYLIGYCKMLKVKKLSLEVSLSNIKAEKFYNQFDFFTVGTRKNYYKDGSDALLKEKKLTTN